MQNDQERDNGPEEGEYHFSDEGAYESHQGEEEKAPTVTERSGLTARFASYRRFVIMGGVFAGVVLVTYLMVSPPITVPPTEITEAVNVPAPPVESVAVVPTVAKTALPPVVKELPKQAKVEAEGPSAFQKVMGSVVSEKNKAEAMVMTKNTAAASTPPPTVSSSEVVQQTPPPPVEEIMSSLTNTPMPAAGVQDMFQPSMGVPVSPTVMAPTQNAPPTPLPPSVDKATLDRLAALEESNAKMISQLNAEYSHKLVEYDTQDKVLQEQIRALTSKMSGMEAEMSQLLQTLNKQASPPSPPLSSNDNMNNVSESSERLSLPSSSAAPSPKSNYSVQAIIPGRAWLRTDNGETVTVAEGDVLRGLGRVTKIDPYDGTIQIDTGSKILTLTYGNGDYA